MHRFAAKKGECGKHVHDAMRAAIDIFLSVLSYMVRFGASENTSWNLKALRLFCLGLEISLRRKGRLCALEILLKSFGMSCREAEQPLLFARWC